MKLTIIPSDKAVYVDGVSFINLDLSSCEIPSNVRALQWKDDKGEIEFYDSIANQEITVLPDWANNCVQAWNVAQIPVPPTDEELILQNKFKAESLLISSDWSVLPDVPLTNKMEWETYRAALRSIVLNPTLNPVWPTKPDSIWP